MNITAEQAARSHETKSDMMLGVSVLLMVLGSAFVAVRLWCRNLIKSTGRDDIASVFALAFLIACGISVAAMTRYGLGRHDWTLSIDQVALYGRCFWLSVLFYTLSLYFCKMAFLLQYLRIMNVSLLPLPIVWRLKLPLSQKFWLSGIFGLGIFTIAISILRLQWLTPEPDITWWNVTAASWSMAELVSGIACSCLPTYKPLLNKVKSLIPSLKYGESTHSLHGVVTDDSGRTIVMTSEDAPYGSRPAVPNSMLTYGTETNITASKSVYTDERKLRKSSKSSIRKGEEC
ncbi:hypothetical protein FAUST_1351 [Fusarium austroamericanum]|uniref:Rhodopsin domain-containing protein n=1 Tax=Fusarium austroamericanum TaxID=282268 RepID=A0AAN6HJU8_FUSAU|nr:hypothetical protein FAUST_1351 [Fusarium austroamericanum]